MSYFLLLALFPLSSLASFLHSPPPLSPRATHSLHKRGSSSSKFSGRATFYATGLGACGNTNTDADFIVALNQPQYEANKWCGKSITISYGGKSHDAVIQDECPGCPSGALDMSPALFKYFASEDAGVFYMSWTLNDGSGSSNNDGNGDGNNSGTPAPAPVHKSPAPAPAYTPPPTPHQDTPTSTAPTYAATATAKVTENPFAHVNFTKAASDTNSSSAAVAKGYVVASTSYGQVEGSSAYDTGGNLDVVSQLVIAFGSLTAASASHAISSGSST